MKELKNKLETMRKEAKLSRHKLAEISGFNEHTIKAYETTDTPPSKDYIRFCSIYFGYEIISIKATGKELVKMYPAEQVLRIFGVISGYSDYQMLSLINKQGFTAKTLQEATNSDFNDNNFENILDFSFKDKPEEYLEELLEYYHIQKDDYTPKRYADVTKTFHFFRGKGTPSDLDVEIIILLNTKTDDFKRALIALLKAQENPNKKRER